MFSSQSKVVIGNAYELDTTKKLGQGATGQVYQGTQIKTGKKVAIKVINLKQMKGEIAQYLHRMQTAALDRINSPYVERCFKIVQDQNFCCIVTQVCNGGTLDEVIHKQKRLSESNSLQIVLGILIGLSEILKKGILHRDLKTQNIMLHNGIPKIIDFGYCQVPGYLKPRKQYNVGSPCYMSPQSYFQNHYDEKTQIWAIGTILYQCLTGLTLHTGQIPMEQSFGYLQANGIHFPSYITQNVKQLISKMLSFDPSYRPSCSSCIKAIQQIRSQASSRENQNNGKPIVRQTVPGRRKNSQVESKTTNENILNLKKKYSQPRQLFTPNITYSQRQQLKPPIKTQKNLQQHFKYGYMNKQKSPKSIQINDIALSNQNQYIKSQRPQSQHYIKYQNYGYQQQYPLQINKSSQQIQRRPCSPQISYQQQRIEHLSPQKLHNVYPLMNSKETVFTRQKGASKTGSPIFVNVNYHAMSDNCQHDTIFSPLLTPPPKILKTVSSNTYAKNKPAQNIVYFRQQKI